MTDSEPGGHEPPYPYYKFSRNQTGEHWSEKIAAEVAAVLGLPHAEVELGQVETRQVSITTNFLSAGETLIHGNELLSRIDRSYPAKNGPYRTREHTLNAVNEALLRHQIEAPTQLAHTDLKAFGLFVGYLLLDALIGNTDRHHENWGAVASVDKDVLKLVLAPTYDHASSLGRELNDVKRTQRLETKDRRADVPAYCERANSAFFPPDGVSSPLSCLESFSLACKLDPEAAKYWMKRLSHLEADQLSDIVQRIPVACMSVPARQFAEAILANRLQILKALSL